jgi:serine/threonine protein phosphatase PrpC
MEDAWQALFDQPCAGQRVHALAVFDGLGGLPHGQEAAWAAAEGLEAALARAPGPERLLAELHEAVRVTGGTTTAVVAVAPAAGAGPVRVAGVGDSSAWCLDAAGRARRVLPLDLSGEGVTDCLGRDLPPRGHAAAVELPAGRSLLLCTDGVDGVAAPASLAGLLRAPPASLRDAMAALLEEVVERGGPDNAAATVLHRRSAHGAEGPAGPPVRASKPR